mmetsp:Transcript_1612/g.3086  ORF Transcript_1612/g.3086 Transcript_1612/m.3086 type:complete len:251 (-) Transcript_1612:463-1215(-)
MVYRVLDSVSVCVSLSLSGPAILLLLRLDSLKEILKYLLQIPTSKQCALTGQEGRHRMDKPADDTTDNTTQACAPTYRSGGSVPLLLGRRRLGLGLRGLLAIADGAQVDVPQVRGRVLEHDVEGRGDETEVDHRGGDPVKPAGLQGVEPVLLQAFDDLLGGVTLEKADVSEEAREVERAAGELVQERLLDHRSHVRAREVLLEEQEPRMEDWSIVNKAPNSHFTQARPIHFLPFCLKCLGRSIARNENNG